MLNINWSRIDDLTKEQQEAARLQHETILASKTPTLDIKFTSSSMRRVDYPGPDYNELVERGGFYYFEFTVDSSDTKLNYKEYAVLVRLGYYWTKNHPKKPIVVITSIEGEKLKKGRQYLSEYELNPFVEQLKLRCGMNPLEFAVKTILDASRQMYKTGWLIGLGKNGTRLGWASSGPGLPMVRDRYFERKERGDVIGHSIVP